MKIDSDLRDRNLSAGHVCNIQSYRDLNHSINNVLEVISA